MTELPTTFGKYFLTEKLATGGMAEIYLAKLVGPGGFEKQLVIKQIHPRLSGQRHFVDLFVTEAKTLVTLTHGNIVPVYELGVIDDTYFIAMEYIDGPTLYRLTESLAKRGARMDPAVAAWICARILEGLDYAHRKGDGVIHRDLSPRNVMLSRDGDTKLVDFGIAVSLGATDDGGTESAPTGSFPYMSPEQVRREALSGQTDLFSAGVLLWEMLVGERLFARTDPDATLAAVTDEPIPRPSSRRPEIPAKLDEVVMRALERDQTARWPSASEMLAQLQRFLYGLDAPPGPREVAALVAKYCPPELRRMPTHADHADHADARADTSPAEASPAEAPVGDASVDAKPGAPRTIVIPRDATPGEAPPGGAPPGGPRTTVIPRDATPGEAPPGGPRTAVIPRDATPAKGKTRARTETFATNVELKHMLERATPLFPIAAITDEPAPSSTSATDEADEIVQTNVAEPSPRASQRAMPRAERPSSTGLADDNDSGDNEVDDGRRDDGPRADGPRDDGRGPRAIPVPGRTPPSRGLLVLAAIGTLALGGAAVFMFLRARESMTTTAADATDAAAIDAPLGVDMPSVIDAQANDVAVDAAVPAVITDAAPGTLDVATPPPDAGARPSRPDASNAGSGNAPPADAAPRVDPASRVDAAPRATGTAALKVGADPWGEVVIDGIARGRTPFEITLPAGKHVVEIIFKGEDPPRSTKKTVELKAGETETVTADFTKP